MRVRKKCVSRTRKIYFIERVMLPNLDAVCWMVLGLLLPKEEEAQAKEEGFFFPRNLIKKVFLFLSFLSAGLESACVRAKRKLTQPFFCVSVFSKERTRERERERLARVCAHGLRSF